MLNSLKEKSVELRYEGWSYNIISDRLGVSKSTLSHWLRDVPYKPNASVRKRIQEGPIISATRRHAKRMATVHAIKRSAEQEIDQLTKRDLWMLGLGLYIGEGSKIFENVRIVNSDANVILLAMRWFRESLHLDTKNFSARLHLYPDTPLKKAIAYWSKITSIPTSQFDKTYVDMRQDKSKRKRRSLPYGTLHITIRSRGDYERGSALHRRIIGWIEAIYKHNDAGIV